MNKTKIEWTDYTSNPIKGKCKMGCPYCYARKIYDRFKLNPEVRFTLDELSRIKKVKKPSMIFLCSTHEIFGSWIKKDWVEWIFDTVQQCPQHIFQILTKCPENVEKFISNRTMPDNIWFGITITGTETVYKQKIMLKCLDSIIAKIKFISFEPLLNKIGPEILDDLDFIDWIIIGAQTNPLRLPEKEWVEEILDYCRRQAKSVFMKDNLGKEYRKLIQEFPIDRKNIDRK